MQRVTRGRRMNLTAQVSAVNWISANLFIAPKWGMEGQLG